MALGGVLRSDSLCSSAHLQVFLAFYVQHRKLAGIWARNKHAERKAHQMDCSDNYVMRISVSLHPQAFAQTIFSTMQRAFCT